MTSLPCPPVGMHASAESCLKHLRTPPRLSHFLASSASRAHCHQTGVKLSLSSTKHLSCTPIGETYQQPYLMHPCFKLEVLAGFSGVADESATGSCDVNTDNLPLRVNAVAPVMKRGYGAFGGATLEKSKLDLSQSTSRVSPQTEDGGGGGDIGNRINFGGGDGGDEGGDDDDYFGDADDGDDGDEGGFFRRRVTFPEVFDRKIVEAILQEWYKTVSDLPAGLYQAVELGLISSAQMARFMAINARPTLSRLISRVIPAPVSRGFIGRMLADPGFLHKMIWEQAVTIGHGVWWEVHHRRERLKDEWDLAAINILTLSICNAAIVWSLAPCRSYGTTFRFNLQNTIQKLPNNVFERSYLLREFDLPKRAQSFFYKAGELCLVGMLAGTAGGSLSKLVALKKGSLSVPLPSVSTSALSYGAFLGLSGNIRYQLLYGAEQGMHQYFDHLGFVVLCSTALRLLNIHIGDLTRLTWLGLEAGPMLETPSLQPAYRRPSATGSPLNDWSIPTEIFPLGFFGGKEDLTGKQSQQKSSRRRKVKRKVMAAS